MSRPLKPVKSFLAIVITILLLLPGVAFGQTNDTDVGDTEGIADVSEVLVVLEEDVPSDAPARTFESDSEFEKLEASGFEVVEELGPAPDFESDILVVETPEDLSREEAIELLLDTPGVAYAQPNYFYDLLEGEEEEGFAAEIPAPNDPGIPSQYYLYPRDGAQRGATVTDAWSLSRTDNTVSIAILDTGIYVDHEDLVDNIDHDNMWDAFNNTERGVITGPEVPYGDNSGHGTHVAGIAAASADNGKGIAGTSYNATIIPIKVFNNETSSQSLKAKTSDIIKAYQYLVGLVDVGELDDLRIINMSLGLYSTYEKSDKLLESEIERARYNYDIVTVCAGGNGDGSSTPKTGFLYPSDFDACVSVTALDNQGFNAVWSDYNGDKDISAPGVSIYSTYKNSSNSYTYLRGTSMASPIVAGCFALVWVHNPRLTVSQAIESVYRTADAVGDTVNDRTKPDENGIISGSRGALNVYEAVTYAQDNYPYRDPVVKRLSGLKAADTAAAISSEGFDTSAYAIVARDDDFADAMSAAGLAGILDAPIVLTGQASLSESAAQELKRLGVHTVYIIGGNGAVLPAVETAIKSLGIQVEPRVAGLRSWDTSVACADFIVSLGGTTDTAIVATSMNFQDALSISSYAYAYKVPIYLETDGQTVDDRELPTEAIERIEGVSTIYVPGGFGAVSYDSVEGRFTDARIERIAGKTGYDTSAAIARYMVEEGLLRAKYVAVACGARDPKGVDSLAGAALVGKNKGVTLLVNGNTEIEAYDTTTLDTFLSEHASSVYYCYALGGKHVMPDDLLSNIERIVGVPYSV